MSLLAVMHRPGIVLVSGTVVDMSERRFTIENDVYLPVSKRSEKRRAVIEMDGGKIARMHLSIGAFVLVTCRDNNGIAALCEGGETNDKTYYLRGYNLRYNGSFDFEAHGNAKETHVFYGSIVKTLSGVTDAGKSWKYWTLSYRRNGEQVLVNVMEWNSSADGTEENRVFVTGPQRRSKNGTSYYTALIVV